LAVSVVVVGVLALAVWAFWSDAVELVGLLKAGGAKAGEPSTTYWAMSGGDLVDGTDGSQRGEQVSGSHVVSPGDRVAVATSEEATLEGDNLVVRLALSGWAKSGPPFTYEVYADGTLLVVESDLDTLDPLLAYLSPVDTEGYTTWSAATQRLTVVIYATYHGCGPTTVAALLGEPVVQLHLVRCGAHFLTSCPVPRVPGPQMHLVVHTALGTDALLYLDGLGAGTTIYWGDGSKDLAVEGENPHTYPNSNTRYRIVIEGTFAKFGPATLPLPSHETYAQILVSVDQWDQGTGTTDASYAFAYATYLTTVATPPTGLTTTAGMFYAATSVNGPMCDWDVSGVSDMSAMFAGAKAFNADIGDWNTQSLQGMVEMFNGAEAFNADIGGWDVSQVTDLSSVFEGAKAFNADITGWDTSGVKNMKRMFYGATSFNRDISLWGPSEVEYMAEMFNDATSFKQNLRCWDVSQVTDVATEEDFADASVPMYQYGWFPLWKTPVCTILTVNTSSKAKTAGVYLDGLGPDTYISWGDGGANGYVRAKSGWNSYTYAGAAGDYKVYVTGTFDVFGPPNSSNTTYPALLRSVDRWDEATGTTDASYAFANADNLVGLVEPPSTVVNMTGMFKANWAPNQAINGWGVTEWDTSHVINMSHMFENARNFDHAIGGWDTSRVTDMQYMFYDATFFNQDISVWKTSRVVDMSGMFRSAAWFDQPIGSWNTSSVETMEMMFDHATRFDQNITAWDTSGVTNMKQMFWFAKAFNQDLSSWSTSKVTNMANMFNTASSFDQDLHCWNVVLMTTPLSYENFAANSPIALTKTKHPVWGTTGCPAAPVAVGDAPYGIALTPDGSRLYVANYLVDGTVTVINTSTKAVVKTIPVSTAPRDVVLTPDGSRAYVMHYATPGVVTVIDTATNEVVGAPIPVMNNPSGMAITPDGGKIYVVGSVIGGTISIINTATNGVTSISGPGGVQLNRIAIANTSPSQTAYMPSVGTTREVSTLNATSGSCCGSISPVPAGALGAVAASPDGALVYGGAGNTVYAINTSTNRILTPTITLGGVSNYIAFSPDSTRAYAVHYADNAISVIDTSSHTLVGTIPTGAGPRGVALSPNGHRAYVTNTTAGTVSFIDL